MKKFSMGLMLSSLLLVQVGCGEEAPAPAPPATPDPAAMMGHAPDAAAPGADGAAAPADGAAAPVEGAADNAGAPDAAATPADAANEPAKDAAP